MSITNIINNKNVTMIQGINGIRFCEESWAKQRRETLPEKFSPLDTFSEAEASDEGTIRIFLSDKKEHADSGHPHTDLLDLI